MSRKHWKNFEAKVASLFGTQRIPVNGRGDEPDLKTDTHVVECKHWAKLPYRVEKALEQAERAATPGQLSIAIIGERKRRWQDALVVMRLSDFVEWYSPMGYPAEHDENGQVAE